MRSLCPRSRRARRSTPSFQGWPLVTRLAPMALVALLLTLPLAGCSDDGSSKNDGSIGGETSTCGPQNCTGCCIGDQCQGGKEAAACGAGGLACVTCRDGESCVDGQCLIAAGKCNTENCPDGCCQGDQCLPGTAKDACGEGGHVCERCGSSSTCTAHHCGCDPNSCPGCCDGTTCKPGNDHDACGKGGLACVACDPTQTCAKSSQTCTKTTDCDPSNCKGCCDGSECKSGLTKAACGKGGLACSTCSAAETCQAGTCNDPSICSASNCAGCCASSVCQAGTDATQCGQKGAACETCAAYEKCSPTGACELDGDKLWSVTVVSATLDPKKSWDVYPANPAPDVYVKLKIDTFEAKTNVLDNTYDPAWNETLGKVKASALLAAPFDVQVGDSDPIKDETIGACSATMTAKVLTAGGNVVLKKCGNDGYVKVITFNFSPL